MNFKVSCWYSDTDKREINDYGKDYVNGRGKNGLVSLTIQTEDDNYFCISLGDAILASTKLNNVIVTKIAFCVNIGGYVYTLLNETKFEFLNFRPLYTAVIKNSENSVDVDKHLEIDFLITEIKNKGTNNYTKLDHPMKHRVYIRFLENFVISVT